jgi:hypothetical protein
MRVEGLDRLQAKLRRAETSVGSGVEKRVREAGEDLLSRSVPVTPLDESTLRQSGNVQPQTGVFRDFGGVYVTVGFDAEYGWAVHETLDANWSTPGTGGKFLESPFAENRDRYINFIKDGAIRGLK